MHWIRRHRRGRPPHPDVLTPAEWRVLDLVRLGLPNAAIAERLGITVPTVKTHMSRILAKLALPDRRALTEWDGQPATERPRRVTSAAPLNWLSWKTAGGLTVTAVAAVFVVGFVAAMESGRLTGGAEPETAVPTASVPPEATAPQAGASETPMSQPSPPVNVLLIELTSGVTHTLHSGHGGSFTPGFEPDGSLWVWRNEAQSATRFGSDGQPIEETRVSPWGDPRCRNVEGDEPSSLIGGESHPHWCGPLSPDGRWMLFTRDLDSANAATGRYETGLYDLDTGLEHLLTDLTRHCGGCDYRAGPAWSPSGRFLLFGETYAGPDSTVYLTDVSTLTTRAVAQGERVNVLGDNVVWSPTEDALALPGPSGGTVVERPALSEALTLADVAWPARFDDTGHFVYSTRRTVIADATTGMSVAEWAGVAQQWPAPRGITNVEGQPAALLEDGDCAGTSVHHPLIGIHCLDDARGAAWSPMAEAVGYARPLTADDPVGLTTWEIVVFDVHNQNERVVASGIASWSAPYITWNDVGTQLVVVAPPPEVLW